MVGDFMGARFSMISRNSDICSYASYIIPRVAAPSDLSSVRRSSIAQNALSFQISARSIRASILSNLLSTCSNHASIIFWRSSIMDSSFCVSDIVYELKIYEHYIVLLARVKKNRTFWLDLFIKCILNVCFVCISYACGVRTSYQML